MVRGGTQKLLLWCISDLILQDFYGVCKPKQSSRGDINGCVGHRHDHVKLQLTFTANVPF